MSEHFSLSPLKTTMGEFLEPLTGPGTPPGTSEAWTHWSDGWSAGTVRPLDSPLSYSPIYIYFTAESWALKRVQIHSDSCTPPLLPEMLGLFNHFNGVAHVCLFLSLFLWFTGSTFNWAIIWKQCLHFCGWHIWAAPAPCRHAWHGSGSGKAGTTSSLPLVSRALCPEQSWPRVEEGEAGNTEVISERGINAWS